MPGRVVSHALVVALLLLSCSTLSIGHTVAETANAITPTPLPDILIDGVMIGGFLSLAWSAALSFLAARVRPFLWLSLTAVTTAVMLLASSNNNGRVTSPVLHFPSWNSLSVPLTGAVVVLLFLVFIASLVRRDAIVIPRQRTTAMVAVTVVTINIVASYVSPQAGQMALMLAVIACILFIIYTWHIRNISAMARILGVTCAAVLISLILHTDMVQDTLGGYMGDGQYEVRIGTLLGGLSGIINLTVLILWLKYIGTQRNESRSVLAIWQAKEHVRLSREVSRQTAALNRALAYAEDKNRQKVQTLGYVGHDLRAPLATILGYVRLLRETHASPNAAHLAAIERSVAFQLALIDDVLDYAKAELQPLNIAPRPTSLDTLINEVASYASILNDAQKNQFICVKPPYLPATLNTDGHRLQQVLLNLLSNASKFTRRGVVYLIIDISQVGQSDNWRAKFTVKDNGIGIDISEQESIFDSFKQLVRNNGGVGLGLFIAERIIDGMKGRLWLTSSHGTGSAFSFEIEAPAIDATLIATRPYSRDEPLAREHMPAALAPLPGPPPPARLELALLARDGRLTDIEEWLQNIVHVHPEFDLYYEEIRKAVLMLDLGRIEALALDRPQ